MVWAQKNSSSAVNCDATNANRYRRLVEVSLSILLLAAFSSKAYELFIHENYTAFGFFQNRFLLSCLIQAEIILSIWFLLGTLPRARFAAAIGCFASFATVATYEAVRGYSSCGCFGSVTVPPRIIAVLDIAA